MRGASEESAHSLQLKPIVEGRLCAPIPVALVAVTVRAVLAQKKLPLLQLVKKESTMQPS